MMSLSGLLIVISSLLISESVTLPNIVFIVADDLGWDDVSFHGSNQVLTPNIDMLAYTGVALERYYSSSVCTPSRAAILTGKYAYTTGMHGYPLTNAEDRGLPVEEKTLPQYLKEQGYATHLVGKWHLGHSRSKYLPVNRGFDSYFGHRGGFIDYYEYLSEESAWTDGPVSGLDLFRNTTPAWDVEGYLTDVYTKQAKDIIMSHNTNSPLFLMMTHNAPHEGNAGALLQAPPEVVRSMRHVESPQRRIFAAMMKKLDDSVGDIIEALNEKQILTNTVVVFISDNGGITQSNYASNWPLRAGKFTPFEGGIRAVGLVWSPLVNPSSHLWKGYMHAVDWLPTFLTAIGVIPPDNIDGVSLWESISNNVTSKRTSIFEYYDSQDNTFATAIIGDYKLVTGNPTYDGYQANELRGIIGKAPPYIKTVAESKSYRVIRDIGMEFKEENINLRNEIRIQCKKSEDNGDICIPSKVKSCLYNVKEDPCEKRDLSNVYPDIKNRMKNSLEQELTRVKHRVFPFVRDPRGKPSLHNFTWATWADNVPTKVSTCSL